jgi:hypothetical protein
MNRIKRYRNSSQHLISQCHSNMVAARFSEHQIKCVSVHGANTQQIVGRAISVMKRRRKIVISAQCLIVSGLNFISVVVMSSSPTKQN